MIFPNRRTGPAPLQIANYQSYYTLLQLRLMDSLPACKKMHGKMQKKNRQIEVPAFLTLISYRKIKADDDFHSILDSLQYVKDTCFFAIPCISKPLQLLSPLFK